MTIPAGQNEVKLPVKADADVAAGQLANLVVHVTGMYDGKVADHQREPKVQPDRREGPGPEESRRPKKDVPKKKDEPKKKK